MEEKQAVCFIKELCRYAGEDDAFARRFWEKLSADEEIYREFLYYIANGNFACQAKVEGYTFYVALAGGVLPFLPGDAVKIIVAVLIGPVLQKRLKQAGVLS